MAAWAERESEPAKVHQLTCAVCGALSGLRAHGWHARRTDDPWSGAKPAVAFLCPTCSARRDGAK